MMWSSIANLKENLNKIALDVHDDDEDDDEELPIYSSGRRDDNSIGNRRFSHSSAPSKSPTNSPVANGFGSPYNSEIEQYKAEIKRLQESEAEIKALSKNYAALLKEKEDQISRLNEENGLLKVQASNASPNASKNSLKVSNDQSPNRQNKGIGRNRSLGSNTPNGSTPKQDGLSNGIRGNEKELADLLEEKNRSLAAMQATHEVQVKELHMELDKERVKSANIHLRLQESQKLNESVQQELNLLKANQDKSATEMTKIQDELSKKLLEIRRLQMELQRRGNEGTDNSVESLKRVITTLEKENNQLKIEKDNLEAALRMTHVSTAQKSLSSGVEPSNKHLNEEKESSEAFSGKEQMELLLQKLENDLIEMRQERDKAQQGLNRLKQHLLEKESEESEKMDEDSKLIEELREKSDYQRAQILQLEKALKQAIAHQEEVKLSNNNEIQKSKESIDELHRKLASCMRTIDAKNVEILNLQTALGQYYAEIEAKERMEEELTVAKEESARLSGLLKDAYQLVETSKKEKEELLSKLSQFERTLGDGKNRVKKLEEDNEKLRRALEQSMTRLNRMSMDSDYYVDRRIVIKLLVTYFQRNHSKEVLDLMVRMLGFSDEDKQRIGLAQQGAGKGVVRGVLGLPGRLVGGILGGGSGEAPQNMASDNQSFADLWVDFLLKETEERERRENEAAANRSKSDQSKGSPDPATRAPPLPDQTTTFTGGPSSFLRSSPPIIQNQGAMFARGNFLRPEHPDSEFSSVPLTSSESNSQLSKLPLKK